MSWGTWEATKLVVKTLFSMHKVAAIVMLLGVVELVWNGGGFGQLLLPFFLLRRCLRLPGKPLSCCSCSFIWWLGGWLGGWWG